ncbi:MAG: methyltransferase domain-containing protein [Patescibacteria group bacterium]
MSYILHCKKPFKFSCVGWNMNNYDLTRYRVMRRLITNVKDKVILDIGAGEYPLSKAIPSKKTILLDGVKEFKPDILCDLNTEKIPLKKESVNMILAGEIIEHLLNPLSFLRECNRILGKNGILILSTPNICSLKNRFRVLFNKIPQNAAMPVNYRYEEDYSIQNHVSDFNLTVLKEILKKAGFKTLKKTCDGIFFRNTRIISNKLIPASFGEKLIVKCQKR